VRYFAVNQSLIILLKVALICNYAGNNSHCLRLANLMKYPTLKDLKYKYA